MKLHLSSEPALAQAAAEAALAWQRARIAPLIVGLRGELGAGKTSFVRAMLEALGYSGRVPSPTYTLLEHYSLGDLNVVHLDLYRLTEPRELEYLGLRDWLASSNVWVLAEWPERGGGLVEACDLELRLDIAGNDQRSLSPRAQSPRGLEALAAWLGQDFNKAG